MTKIAVIAVSYPDQNIFDYFTELDQVNLKSTNNIKIGFEFKPRKRISFIAFDYEADIVKDLLNISIFVNKFRNCIEN